MQRQLQLTRQGITDPDGSKVTFGDGPSSPFSGRRRLERAGAGLASLVVEVPGPERIVKEIPRAGAGLDVAGAGGNCGGIHELPCGVRG